ncbi:Gfo/Idh/MocA family protein [Kordiimonas gwangyangensis]|uniref:Gfo/Idh/MocA family protein n=1 Tax=Kordiimonas gwangyangensis TaxID=288022 RepID=UPI000399C982|nr:Gfo/Idh/MocA family oxidoreductase [Kordiimonas gwangyangensis]
MVNLTAAIIGTGFMGPTHAEALARIGVQVRGILGSSAAKSEDARAALGLAKAYTSYDEVLADPAVQAVHLCVPNVLHADYAKRALAAGKHVMCEKPLAMTTAETRELVALARESGLAAGVCYNLRYYPLNLHARALVDGGDIGRLHHVNGSYVQDWLLHDTDYNWRLNSKESGALRAVADIGTHWMDMVSHITGHTIEAVFADLTTFYKTRKKPVGDTGTFSRGAEGERDYEDVSIDTEDYGAIMLRLSGGAVGSLHVSQMVAGRKNALRYEIAGSKSSLAWDCERPNELWIGHRDKPNQMLLKDPSLMAPNAAHHASYPGGHSEGYPDTFKQCFRAFYDHIAAGLSGDPQYPTFEDGHRQVALCEAILESNRTATWVRLESEE